VDTLTLAVADAGIEFVNPAIEQTIGVFGKIGVDAAEKFSSSTPVSTVMITVTTTLDSRRL
jgi:hypothetical protein